MGVTVLTTQNVRTNISETAPLINQLITISHKMLTEYKVGQSNFLSSSIEDHVPQLQISMYYILLQIRKDICESFLLSPSQSNAGSYY